MNNTCRECEKQKFVLPYEYLANPLTIVEEGGDWIQSAIKHPGRCTPGSPNYDCPKGSPQWNLAQRFKHGDLHKGANGGEMIKRADGSYSRRGLWDNIRANRGSGKKPTKEMLEQERKIKSKQMGGDSQSQIIELIKMYAQMHNVQPQVIVQKLQQLDESQQEQALQSMVAEIQQAGGMQQQSAPMSYANNDEMTQMPSYAPGGVNNYPRTGGTGYRGVAGGFDGVPYIAPAIHTTIGDSKFFGPLKALTGYMGLASGLGASALGWGKSAQWLGNKALPDGKFKEGFNNVMDGANNTFKNIVDFGVSGVIPNRQLAANTKQNPAIKNRAVQRADFTKMPVFNDNPKYDGTMVAEYGGYLPKHQGTIPGVSSTVGGNGEAGLMMNDGSTDYNEGYYQAYQQDNNAYKTDPNQCAPGSECDKAKKQQQQQQQAANKNANANAGAGNGAGEKPFSGMEYAQKGMIGLGMFRDYTQWKNDQKEKKEYENMLKRVGNTDFRLASNNPNPFGDYTLNVGPANNFQLGMTTPIQDFGTARYGGSYEEGGEYQVSEEELLQLMRDGAEIEFINN